MATAEINEVAVLRGMPNAPMIPKFITMGKRLGIKFKRPIIIMGYISFYAVEALIFIVKLPIVIKQ